MIEADHRGGALTLFGVGRMGLALLRGWRSASSPLWSGGGKVEAVDPLPSAEAVALGARTDAELAPQDIVVLAIKPQSLAGALDNIRPCVGAQTLLVSVMAGIGIERLVSDLGSSRVVRAMPNTPGAIGRGITAFASSAGVDDAALALTRRLLAPLGNVVGPIDEAYIDAVTALSGSGPAYVFALVEAMTEAGIAAGLPDQFAAMLARQTVVGSAALLEAETASSPAQLRAAVTSPGGTTAAALDVLMARPGGLADLLEKAVAAGAARSHALGQA